MVITWQLYERTGDVSILQHFYPGLRGWVDCLLNLYKASGLTGLPNYWGDWEATGRNTNGSLVSAFPFLRDVNTLVSIATVLKDDAVAKQYNATYNNLTAEFHATFYRPDLVGYGDGSQAGNVLALASPGVVPDDLRAAVVKNLVADIQAHDGMWSIGIVSVAQLFPVLSSNGQHDLALRLAQQTKYPSYGQLSLPRT
jgi:alpha-L-rhamnosidase